MTHPLRLTEEEIKHIWLDGDRHAAELIRAAESAVLRKVADAAYASGHAHGKGTDARLVAFAAELRAAAEEKP